MCNWYARIPFVLHWFHIRSRDFLLRRNSRTCCRQRWLDKRRPTTSASQVGTHIATLKDFHHSPISVNLFSHLKNQLKGWVGRTRTTDGQDRRPSQYGGCRCCRNLQRLCQKIQYGSWDRPNSIPGKVHCAPLFRTVLVSMQVGDASCLTGGIQGGYLPEHMCTGVKLGMTVAGLGTKSAAMPAVVRCCLHSLTALGE